MVKHSETMPFSSQDNSDEDQLARTGIRIPHLKLIVSLDDYGQISAAASVLNMSQPAASRMLSDMETILEAPLYDRLPRGIALTPYGKAFARRSRTILLELREASREISDLKNGTGGSVFLGAVTAPAVQIVIPAIRQVRERYPRIKINVQVETSNILAKDLLASRHDFIIARIPDDLNPRQFNSREIGIEKACLVVRRDHPLATRSAVELDELNAFEWVFQPAGSLLNRTVEKLFLARSVALPERIVNTSSLLMTMVMIRESNAISPMALEVAKRFTDKDSEGSLAILNLGFDINVQPFSLITVRDRQLSPAAMTMFDCITREVENQKL